MKRHVAAFLILGFQFQAVNYLDESGQRGKKKTTQLSSLMTIIILLETLWRHTAGTAAQSCEEIKILESFKVWHAAALLKRKKNTTTQRQDGMRGWITNSFPFAILFPPCSSPCSVSRQRGSTEREKKSFFILWLLMNLSNIVEEMSLLYLYLLAHRKLPTCEKE